MGSNHCMNLPNDFFDNQNDSQSIFDESQQSPFSKYSSFFHQISSMKFFPDFQESIGDDPLSYFSLENASESQATGEKSFFRMETGGGSTNSLYIDEGSESFGQSFGSESEDIDLNPNSYYFNPIKQRIEKFIKQRKENINKVYDGLKIFRSGVDKKIYLAVHKQTKQKKVVKAITLNRSQLKKTFTNLKEVQIISKLDHPNIIRISQIFHTNNSYYLVMEYCEGGDLTSFHHNILNVSLQTKSLICKTICSQVLNVLAYLHGKNILHGKITKNNIMLMQEQMIPIEDNLVKIVDFSKAKYLKQIPQKMKAEVQNYCQRSPEQILQNINTFETDIWNLGKVLFWLLTQQEPFIIRESSQNKKIQFEKNQKGWERLEQNPEKLLSKMLSLDYENRPSAIECLQFNFFQSQCESSYFGKNENHVKIMIQKKRERSKSNFFHHVQSLMVFKNIPQGQLQQLSNFFISLDKDHSGTVELSEILALLNNVGDKSNLLKQAIEILKKIDRDESGEIDYHEFLTQMCKKNSLFSKELVQDIFNHFDFDQDGIIDEEEFKKELQGISDPQFHYYLRKIDTNGGKQISKDKFIELISKEYKKYYGNQKQIF